MQTMLTRILMYIIAANVFALGMLIVFMINARINLKRNILHQRFLINLYKVTRAYENSQSAATHLGVSVEEYEKLCESRGLETPEQRRDRIGRQEEKKQAEQRRIMEEEATWRAEQERIMEERRKMQEEEARRRKERLKKFGFR